MPAYMHGNLAVEQRPQSNKPKGGQKPKEPIKASYRRGLPVQEKLLYLFTVIICVLVAGVIIWRYAQIYEMNTTIQKIEVQIKQLEAENMVLKKKVNDLSSSEHLLKEAERLGFTVPDDKQVKTANAGSAPSGSAKKTKDQP